MHAFVALRQAVARPGGRLILPDLGATLTSGRVPQRLRPVRAAPAQPVQPSSATDSAPQPALSAPPDDEADDLVLGWGMSAPLEDVLSPNSSSAPPPQPGGSRPCARYGCDGAIADDLVVMSATRAEHEREVIELTARLLSSLLHHAGGPALIQDLLPEVLPWARFLPTADRHILVQEFVDTTEAAASIDNVAPIAQLLVEWRHTAEVHADPELHALLSAPRGEDHGPALPPDPQVGE